MAHDAETAIIVTSEPIRVVGNDWVELGNAHRREKVNTYVAVWTGLVNGIERDKTLLDMVITAGSPSDACKIIVDMKGDEGSEAAQDKKKEELTFRIGK